SGPPEVRAARGLRPLDRRAHLAHPRRDRGRPQAAAADHHRAQRRLRVRQSSRRGREPALKAGRQRGRGVKLQRLYLHIYLTLVGSLGLFALIAGVLWHTLTEAAPPRQAFEDLPELAQASLAEADAPLDAQQAALNDLRARVRGRFAGLALYSAEGERIASAGAPVPRPEPGRRASGWIPGPEGRQGWAIALPDGRLLVARLPRPRPNPMRGLLIVLGLITLGVAVGAYPVVRRLTRRLERLKASVEALGAGDLSARVTVEGSDEVSALAASFNRAAGRIEELVGAHKKLLANASHELRSPLARIRMGIEMLRADAKPGLREELARNIAELDTLIDEILLASRLEAVKEPEPAETVD